MAARQKTLDLDIRIKVGFFKHHKTQKLRRAVGADGVLALLELMCWARSNRHKGKLDEMTDEDIEIAAGWMGTPGALASALVVTEWLDGETGAREIHEWKEHQSYSFHADKRVAIAKKGAKARHNKTYGDSKQHAGSKQAASNQHAPSQPSYSLSSPAPIAGEEKSARANLGALEGPPVARREAEPERPREHYPPGPVAPLFVPPPRRLPQAPKSA